MLLLEKIPIALQTAFAQKVNAISAKLNVRPDWLMVIMDLESKLNPSAVNRTTGATGLIQFLRSTAQDLGTSTTHLLQMNHVEQLNYVEKYLLQIARGKTLESFVDVYLLVFYPAGIKRGYTEPIPMSNEAKKANAAYMDKNGNITKQSIEAVFKSRYPQLFANTVGPNKQGIKASGAIESLDLPFLLLLLIVCIISYIILK